MTPITRTHRFLSGLSFGYLQQVLIIAAGLWLTPFLLHRLGQHDYGIWLIMTQATAYLGFLDLGVVGLLPRETAAAVGRGGAACPELRRLIGQTARLVMVQVPLVALCAAVFWLVGRVTWRSTEGLLGIILAVFVASFPFRMFSAILQGLQEIAFLAKVQIVAWSLSTAVSILLILDGWGLMALAVSWGISQLIAITVNGFRLKRHFPDARRMILSGKLDWSQAIQYLKKSTWISVSQCAQLFSMGSDVLLIGKLLGPAAVVPYSCTGKLAGVFANKPQMLMQAAFPGLSEMKTAESRPRIRQATLALGQAMLALSGGVACVVLAVNRGFIAWWVGPNQYGGGLLTLLVVVAMLARHWNLTFAYSLFTFGYERRLALTSFADGCVSLAGSILLISLLGPIGAPLGMLAGTCLVNMPANLLPLAREMETSAFALLSSSFGWAARFVLASLGGVLLARLWMPHGFLQVAALAVCAGAIYLGLLAPVLFREPLGTYIRPRLLLLPAVFHRLLPAESNG